MPSLRRTLSSPSVRSSPYSLSSAVNNGLGTRNQGHGHRRSTGSETTIRRVLADIDWWRVTEGQDDPDAEQEELDEPNRVHAPNEHVQNLIAEASLRGAGVLSIDGAGVKAEALPTLPTDQLSALSVGPYTPPYLQHLLDSPASSSVSTPEPSERSFEDLFAVAEPDTRFSDLGVPRLPSRMYGGAKQMTRSYSDSFVDYMAFDNDTIGKYADFTVSPPSFDPLDFFD